MKCTALTGVSRGTVGWSVKGRCSGTVSDWLADMFVRPTSVAVTVTSDVSADIRVTVTRLPGGDTNATDGEDEFAP